MRLNGLVLTVMVALAAAACTKTNPNYCADAQANSCVLADAAAHDRPEVAPPSDAADAGDASDVADSAEVADATTDASDASEAKAICSNDDICLAMDAGTAACDMGADGGARCVECTANTHCKGAKPSCDTTAKKCVECTGVDPTNECKAAGLSACDTAAQKCVECTNSTKCGGATPVCDTPTKSCRLCRSDSECGGPGICVDWDGHCAAMSEVVFLDRGGSCDQTQAQYCASSAAVAALGPQKQILLITGTMPVAAITVTGAVPSQVLIVGRGAASVGAGAGDTAGIAMDGVRKVWVRDLKVSGGTVGVLASSGAELHLTRATIVGNGAGGVRTIGSSFIITNTIIAANSQGDATGAVSWAGARLGDLPTGGVGRFDNNTVVDNLQIGVACSTPYDITSSIVHGNTGGQSINCGASSCCGGGDPDPKLDASYHLMSGSPCIDKITATQTTLTVDIQGQPRPGVGGLLDCGADEFH